RGNWRSEASRPVDDRNGRQFEPASPPQRKVIRSATPFPAGRTAIIQPARSRNRQGASPRFATLRNGTPTLGRSGGGPRRRQLCRGHSLPDATKPPRSQRQSCGGAAAANYIATGAIPGTLPTMPETPDEESTDGGVQLGSLCPLLR